MTESLDSSHQKYRIAKDLAQRSLPGIFIYPLVWPLLSYGADLHHTHHQLIIIAGVILTVLSMCRLYHYLSFRRVDEDSSKNWITFLFVTVLPQGTAWGVLFSIALSLDNHNFILYMAFSTAGIVAGGTNNYSPHKRLSISFIITFLIPPIFTALFLVDQIVLGITLIFFIVFMVVSAKNQHREYWRSLQNEALLAKQSRTDSLTKLDNRRFFDEKLNELCHLSSRNHEQLAILVIDCDHFKKINDQYGHDAGDLVLQHVANILKSSLPRATDVCARYGGEEFSALLPGTDLKGAAIVAERIRENIESNPLYHAGKMIKVTVSIGITAHHINQFQDDLPRELFREADQALYTAKSRGRNRCITYEFEVE